MELCSVPNLHISRRKPKTLPGSLLFDLEARRASALVVLLWSPHERRCVLESLVWMYSGAVSALRAHSEKRNLEAPAALMPACSIRCGATPVDPGLLSECMQGARFSLMRVPLRPELPIAIPGGCLGSEGTVLRARWMVVGLACCARLMVVGATAAGLPVRSAPHTQTPDA